MYTIIDLCFLCLKNKKNLKCLSSKDCDGFEKKLKCVLMEILQIDPQVSKHICIACLKNVDRLYDFKQSCKRNINTLNNYIHTLKSKNDPYTNLQVTLIDIKQLKLNRKSITKTTISHKTNVTEDEAIIIDIIDNNLEENNSGLDQKDITDNIDDFIDENIAEFDQENITDNIDDNIDKNIAKFVQEHIIDNNDDKIEFELQDETIKEADHESVLKIEEIPENLDTNDVEYELIDGLIEKVDNNEELFKIEEHEQEGLVESPEILTQESIITETISDNADNSSKDDFDIENVLQDYVLIKKNKNDTNGDRQENVAFKKGRSVILEHFSDNSEPAEEYSCSICDKSFETYIQLHSHKRMKHKQLYKCAVCSKTFTDRVSLKEHERSHILERPFQCPICDACFKQESSVRFHLQTHSKVYKCDICGQVFKRNDYLTKHRFTHNVGGLLQCNICDESFTNNRSLNIHKRGHNSNRSHKCDLCDKSFIYKDHLNAHKKSHTAKKDPQTLFPCHICQAVFTVRSKFQNHLHVHSNGTSHKCDECGRMFKAMYALNRHKGTHEGLKKVMCDLCGNYYARAESLKRHKKYVHNVEDDSTQKEESLILERLLREPAAEPTVSEGPGPHLEPYKCELCGETCAGLYDYRSHKRTHSQGPIKCEFCNLYFKNIYKLNMHKYSHTGLKPFACNVCGKRFLRTNSLNSHILIHSENKPMCDLCGKLFSQLRYLERHKQSAHCENPSVLAV